MTHVDDQLRGLADHLREARPRILQCWQEAVVRDPQLTTAYTISRTQFNDHIPQVLEAFERRLRANTLTERRQAQEDQSESAAEHGLHRWQQGYDQRETMREWGHLHLCVLAELERYAREQPSLEASLISSVRGALVHLCSDGVCESVERYTRMQQAEAAGRLRDLEGALRELQDLERGRAEAWREAAHDLRSTVQVINSASSLLAIDSNDDPKRTRLSQALRRNIGSLQELLGDLMDLARLEAGHERRKIAPFDAAVLLKEFCASIQGLAVARHLFLNTDGPPSLLIEGDAIKVRRIVQNLVLNALKVTKDGGVRVTWQEHENPESQQWIVCVQDTGPGFDPAHAPPLVRVLKQATATAQEVEVSAMLSGETGPSADPAPTLESKTDPAAAIPSGEGIGLSIVKRLCELLDASLELQTEPGSGTTFRVILPRHYPSPASRDPSPGHRPPAANMDTPGLD